MLIVVLLVVVVVVIVGVLVVGVGVCWGFKSLQHLRSDEDGHRLVKCTFMMATRLPAPPPRFALSRTLILS